MIVALAKELPFIMWFLVKRKEAYANGNKELLHKNLTGMSRLA